MSLFVNRPTIAFAGLSHLGLVSAVAAAEKGFTVIGFDPDAGLVERIARGELSVFEPNLDELFQRNTGRMRFTGDVSELHAADVVFISRDVPTDSANVSSLAPILSLAATVSAAMKAGATLVILSQVSPGFTRSLLNGGLSFAADRCQLLYQVETLVFGQAVRRALEPERFIIGAPDPQQALPDAYRIFLEAFDCPLLPMRYESAELTKIAINLFLLSSLSTTNSIAEICERIGADWGEIAPALRLDRRIGPHAYLAPGLGVAGGNLERDLSSITRLAGETGADPRVFEAWQANLRYRRDWVIRLLSERVLAKLSAARVAVWGLSYKEETASTKNSPSLHVLRSFPQVRFQAFDPIVRIETAAPDRLENARHVEQCSSPLGACAGCDALLVMTPWKLFYDFSAQDIATALAGKIVIDPYHTLQTDKLASAGLTHFRLGAPTNEIGVS